MSETLDNRKLLSERGICTIIPVYNNEKSVQSVVEETLKYCSDVIVVNDGSTDSTASLLKKIPNITLIEYVRNRGKGYALKRAFRKAKEMGFAYAITLDADGQHFAKDINSFLEANIDYPGELIVGSRALRGASKGSSFANKFSNFWFTVQTFKKLSDTQTGYRLYPLKKLYGLPLLSSRYEAELELLVAASWHGVGIKEIPVEVYYAPKEERVSHFRPGKDFLRITLLNTILCILGLVYALPLKIFKALFYLLRNIYAYIAFGTLALIIVAPYVILYTKLGKMTQKKRDRLHRLIYNKANFIVNKHGIPGVKLQTSIAEGAKLEEPKIIICNHQSHLDLITMLTLSPKMVFLTNDWVQNNPVYGYLIRHAEFYSVSEGVETLMPKLENLKERGFSIAVFPEGTRSKDCKIGRFHQGAFYLADQLKLNVLPMYLWGAGRVLPKGKFTLRRGTIYLKVDNPLELNQIQAFGGLREQASAMRKMYKENYRKICNEWDQNV